MFKSVVASLSRVERGETRPRVVSVVIASYGRQQRLNQHERVEGIAIELCTSRSWMSYLHEGAFLTRLYGSGRLRRCDLPCIRPSVLPRVGAIGRGEVEGRIPVRKPATAFRPDIHMHHMRRPKSLSILKETQR